MRNVEVQNSIMDLPREFQYIGFSALVGILMVKYDIDGDDMSKFCLEAKEKAIEYHPEILEVSHEQAA